MLSNCGAGSWESFGLQGDQTSQSGRKSTLNIHWKDWLWSWSSNTLALWCKEPTHWKRPWSWERLKAKGEGEGRGRDGWMASLTQQTWIWASSRRQEAQRSLVRCGPWGHRIRQDSATEQQQCTSRHPTDLYSPVHFSSFFLLAFPQLDLCLSWFRSYN